MHAMMQSYTSAYHMICVILFAMHVTQCIRSTQEKLRSTAQMYADVTVNSQTTGHTRTQGWFEEFHRTSDLFLRIKIKLMKGQTMQRIIVIKVGIKLWNCTFSFEFLLAS